MRHLRLLVWLRWKYLWRATAQKQLAFVIMGLGSLAIAFMLFIVLWSLMRTAQRREMGPEAFLQWSTAGFAILYLGWLYMSSHSDLYDPQRLVMWPIHPRTVFWGSCLSALAGTTPLILAGMGGGLVFGREAPVGTQLLRCLLVLLFGAHLVLLSRLVRLSFLQILTSRRWREIMVVFSAILGGLMFLGFRLLTDRGRSTQVVEGVEWLRGLVEGGSLSTWLCWLPSSWFARAFEADGWGAAAGAGGFLAATGVVVLLGGVVERRLAFSEPVFAYSPRRKAAAGGPPFFLTGIVARIARLAGGDVAAVARKELSTLGRDPTVRARFLTSFFYLLVPMVAPFLMKEGYPTEALPDLTGGALLFLEAIFLMNLFGTDGNALRALASLPTPRRRIILGKNLCHAVLFLPVNFTFIAVATGIFGKAEDLPQHLVYHAAAFVVLAGVGGVFSIVFPSRLIMVGQRIVRTEEDPGCLMIFLRSLAYFGALMLLLPVVGARFIGEEAGFSWALKTVLLPASIVYALALYGLGLWASGRLLRAREERLADFFARA